MIDVDPIVRGLRKFYPFELYLFAGTVVGAVVLAAAVIFDRLFPWLARRLILARLLELARRRKVRRRPPVAP